MRGVDGAVFVNAREFVEIVAPLFGHFVWIAEIGFEQLLDVSNITTR